jgi:hypothetical protein
MRTETLGHLESATRPGPARTHCGDSEPMNIPQNHVALLMEPGYTEPEARFLYVVATHSGYFILRQFLNFTAREEENDPISLHAKSLTTDMAQSATIRDTAPSITFFRGLSTVKSREAISKIAASIRLITFVRVWSCLISFLPILNPSISKPSRARSSSSAKN